MGLSIDQAEFSEQDYQRFSERLRECLACLEPVLSDPDFGGDSKSWGAELELYVVGDDGNVRLLNEAIVERHGDPLLTLELNRFNLEYNLAPVFGGDRPFSMLQAQLDRVMVALGETASSLGVKVVPVGILPTLRRSDIGPHCMTQLPRYHALTRGLKRMGSGVFRVHIDGDPPLDIAQEDLTLEGANTSFQFHYRVANHDFAHVFNAFLLATPILAGVSANSPTLFGHRLWHETRVPLFKHSIDSRVSNTEWSQPARVSLGQGWVRESAYELFAQAVAIHPPLLPVCGSTDYRAQMARGELPDLDELCLHQNSVWPWLRPVYATAGSGHLRIELRLLPAGPTNIDMLANAAFYVGLAEGLKPHLKTLLPAMPFSYVKYNFYRAAQFGLGARLVWPRLNGHQLEEHDLRSLAQSLLPVAREGLMRIGIAPVEADHYLAVIARRLDTAQNGAQWQLDSLDALIAQGMDAEAARYAMLQRYMTLSAGGVAVSEWPAGD
jgi:gamma-glutamyl:cysteine ligase YbdK (ATP-grasp superfamily)